MSMMSLQQALALIQPRIPQARLVGDGAIALARIHTDSRSLQAGDLFVALQGERFDAHDFLPQVRQAGAVAALAGTPSKSGAGTAPVCKILSSGK